MKRLLFLAENDLSRNIKIGVFPIKDTEWQDTGNWLDYMNIINKRTT
jgi:hypothetical protein